MNIQMTSLEFRDLYIKDIGMNPAMNVADRD